MKILSQSKKELYDFERNNIFVVDDVIFISGKVNIYDGKPGVLGQYNSEEECKEVLKKMMFYYINKTILIYEMPKKKEETDENQ